MKKYAKILAVLISSVCVFAFAGCGEATIISNPYSDSGTSSGSSDTGSGSSSSDNTSSGNTDSGSGNTDSGNSGSGNSGSGNSGSGNSGSGNSGSGNTDSGSGNSGSGSGTSGSTDLLSALAVENLYNVTVTGTVYEISTDTTNGVTETDYTNGTITLKNALDYSGTYVTGNMYEYDSAVNTGSSGNYSATMTEYITLTNSYCLFAYKYTETGSEVWDYSLESGIRTSDFDFDLDTSAESLYGMFTELADAYESNPDDFTYSNGVYSYTYSDISNYRSTIDEYAITVSGGYITSIYEHYTYSFLYNDTGWGYEDEFYYNFSNYGTTTINVPTEYTYNYYLANNAG